MLVMVYLGVLSVSEDCRDIRKWIGRDEVNCEDDGMMNKRRVSSM